MARLLIQTKTWTNYRTPHLLRYFSTSSDPDPTAIKFSTPAISNYRKKLTTDTDFEIPLSVNNPPASISSPTPTPTQAIPTIKKQIPEIQFSVPIIKNKLHQETDDVVMKMKTSEPVVVETNNIQSAALLESEKKSSSTQEGNSSQSKAAQLESEPTKQNDFKFPTSHIGSGLFGFFLGLLTSYLLIKNNLIEVNTGIVVVEESENLMNSSKHGWLQLPKIK